MWSKILFLLGLLLIATAAWAQGLGDVKETVYWRDVALMAVGIVSALMGIVFRMHLSLDKERRDTFNKRLTDTEADCANILTMQANIANTCQLMKITERRISRIEGVLIPSGWSPREHTGD